MAEEKVNALGRAPTSIRQSIIEDHDADEEDRVLCAAIELQRQFRGFLTRKSLINLQKSKEMPEDSPADAIPDELNESAVTADDTTAAADDPAEADVPTTTEVPAVAIPSAADIPDTSKTPPPSGIQGDSETEPAEVKPKKILPPPKYPPNEAVNIIQRAWRRYIDMQVYRYYRDLVNFQSRGNPMTMLRCINPKEAEFLDAASGVHLKFRLAGDLGANAPRDYTSLTEKKVPMAFVHNKTSSQTKPAEKESNKACPQTKPAEKEPKRTGSAKQGWYQRIENNGWRLVSDRLIHHAMNDPVTWSSSIKPVQFEHTKLLRMQDVEKKRKKKKIDWMKKMYEQGMLKAKSVDEETIQLVEGAAEGMIATADKEGVDGVQDWEVDELLGWTSSLNFDQYLDSWTATGASSTSDFEIVERRYLKMLSLTSKGGSRAESGPDSAHLAARLERLPAQNTPATPFYPVVGAKTN